MCEDAVVPAASGPRWGKIECPLTEHGTGRSQSFWPVSPKSPRAPCLDLLVQLGQLSRSQLILPIMDLAENHRFAAENTRASRSELAFFHLVKHLKAKSEKYSESFDGFSTCLFLVGSGGPSIDRGPG